LGEIGIHGVYLAGGGEIARGEPLQPAEGGTLRAPGGRGDRTRAMREGRSRARESDMDRRDAGMQSSEEVDIYAKPQPLFAKFTKLQTSIAKPLEGYFLVFFTNMSMQSLFAKPSPKTLAN